MIFGGKVLIFLCFFMGAVCCASTFSVPSNWESTEGRTEGNCKVEKMANPASVGLQACEVRQGLRGEDLFMRNLKGEGLLCAMSFLVDLDGCWIFSIGAEKGCGGEVYLKERDKRKFVEVCVANNVVATRDLGDFNLWSQANNIQYDFGEERVTVRKFLGDIFSGESVFVSAAIAYNDIKTIEIGCGTELLSKRLSATTTIETLFFGAEPNPVCRKKDKSTLPVCRRKQGSTFPLPCSWKSSEIRPNDKVLTMSDPASVGLQACEVRQREYREVLRMRNLEGVSLFCAVHNHVVHDGGWLFSINAEQGGFGEVYFKERDKRKFAEVAVNHKRVATHDLGNFNLWSQAHNIQYDFGEERVTVRKFLGQIDGGDCRELFVSATIAYNDISNIEFCCGTSQLNWSSGPFNDLKRLSATTTIRTLCLDATKECGPLHAGESQ